MSTANPLVSVILPCYNAEKFIEEAVGSILNQSYTNLELLVVDDGSTDQSLTVLQSIKDDRLHVTSQKNVGYRITLNNLLQLAKGDFICRMDADDISLPQRIEKEMDFMMQHPNCALVGTWAEILCEGELEKRYHKHPTSNLAIKFFLLFDNPFVHSSVMMRKSALDKVGVYNVNKPWEDYDLWSRMALHFELANLPQVHQVYRELNTGVSKTTKDYSAKVAQQSLENMLKYLPEDEQGLRDICNLYYGEYRLLSKGCSAASIENTFTKLAHKVASLNTKDEVLFLELQNYYLSFLEKRIKRYKRFGKTFLFVRELILKWKWKTRK